MLQLPVVLVVVLLTLSVPAMVCPDERAARAITIRNIQMYLPVSFERDVGRWLFIGDSPCSTSLLVWLQSHLEGIPFLSEVNFTSAFSQRAICCFRSLFLVFSRAVFAPAITNCALVLYGTQLFSCLPSQ
jgi:hypothetical protein